MKQISSFLSIYANWRLDTVILLFCFALMLMCSEADSLLVLFLTKVAAVALAYLAIRLCYAWIDKLPEVDEE